MTKLLSSTWHRHRSPAVGGPRTIRVNIALDDAENAIVTAAAGAAGLTRAGYAAIATVAAASQGATPELDPMRAAVAELLAARTAVNRIGGNLNQATAALNATGAAPVWLGDVVAIVARTIERVDAAVGELRRAWR